jgi:ribosomal protein S18 acetylase RimI-like enzyme
MKPLKNHSLRHFTLGDYREAMTLWKNTEGLGLGESDTPEKIAAFLERNPGLSRVAVDQQGRIVGTLLCGHDGRRGYFYHLAVAKDQRRLGLGRALIESCLKDLKKLGIFKCNLFLIADNESGREFWTHAGWKARKDLVLIQQVLG